MNLADLTLAMSALALQENDKRERGRERRKHLEGLPARLPESGKDHYPREYEGSGNWLEKEPCEVDATCIKAKLNAGGRVPVNPEEEEKAELLFRFPNVMGKGGEFIFSRNGRVEIDSLPFPMYPQVLVAEATAQCVLQGKHAVLESPTGTGKTAALLGGSLGAQRHLAAKFGKTVPIVYCTRTHGQTAQIARELKKGPYRPSMVVLGSKAKGGCCSERVQDYVRREWTENKNFVDSDAICVQARNNHADPRHMRPGDVSCDRLAVMKDDFQEKAWRKTRPRVMCDVPGAQNEGPEVLHDIEDLAKTVGQELGGCSYFYSRSLVHSSEIILCPYQYILDPSVRRSTGLKLGGKLLILDEAHNIEDILREGGSCEMDEQLMDPLEINGEPPRNADIFKSVACLQRVLRLYFKEGNDVLRKLRDITAFFRKIWNAMRDWKREMTGRSEGGGGGGFLALARQWNKGKGYGGKSARYSGYKGAQTATYTQNGFGGSNLDTFADRDNTAAGSTNFNNPKAKQITARSWAAHGDYDARQAATIDRRLIAEFFAKLPFKNTGNTLQEDNEIRGRSDDSAFVNVNRAVSSATSNPPDALDPALIDRHINDPDLGVLKQANDLSQKSIKEALAQYGRRDSNLAVGPIAYKKYTWRTLEYHDYKECIRNRLETSRETDLAALGSEVPPCP